MEDFKRCLDEIVDPTVKEFEDHPDSKRHAFIACVVIFHAIDYLAFPKKSSGLRQQFRKNSPDFEKVDAVAHAFKHVESRTPDTRLNVTEIVSHGGHFQAASVIISTSVKSQTAEVWGLMFSDEWAHSDALRAALAKFSAEQKPAPPPQ